MKVWGYWATLGWAVLAFLVGQFAGLILLLWRAPDWSVIQTMPFDGILVTLFVLISNPITIAILALAVRIARAPQKEYFALVWPPVRTVAISVGWLVALAASKQFYDYAIGWLHNPLWQIALFFWSWAFFYHFWTGIRHLLWDAGFFLSIRGVYATGWFAFGISAFAIS